MAGPELADAAAPADRPRGRITVFADDVSVTYRVYAEARPRLRQLVSGRFRRRSYHDVRALQRVGFTAHEGEVLGLVGANGSGKSTLCQALAGLLPVDSGRIAARSQPALLGVGAALQPSLSGRRNIALGAYALGMSREQLAAAEPEIVAFTELGDAIDRPMRTYSSGMRARLLFAIATSVRPDILLLDEALAVGDERFRRRSEERIGELRDQAGTVFLVSHSLQSITSTATRCLWLDQGVLVADGEPKEVVKAYRRST